MVCLVTAQYKYVKIKVLYDIINILVGGDFVYILNGFYHVKSLRLTIENLDIRLVFEDVILTLNGHYKVVSIFFCPFKQAHMPIVKKVINANC